MRVLLQPEGDHGKVVPIADGLMVVGRASWCDHRIVHKSVSKSHCILVKTHGVVVLRDLGSTNGTRVNGQRVRRGTLLPNDIISFANFRYRLVYTNDPLDQSSPHGRSSFEPFPSSGAIPPPDGLAGPPSGA